MQSWCRRYKTIASLITAVSHKEIFTFSRFLRQLWCRISVLLSLCPAALTMLTCPISVEASAIPLNPGNVRKGGMQAFGLGFATNDQFLIICNFINYCGTAVVVVIISLYYLYYMSDHFSWFLSCSKLKECYIICR